MRNQAIFIDRELSTEEQATCDYKFTKLHVYLSTTENGTNAAVIAT